MSFQEKYRDLEARFKALAEADGDVYLPNVEPSGPVRYVFIALEPSLGRWASSPQEARARVEAGFRNFVADQVVDVVLLHHAIRYYLGTESYHLTDFSKGAMLTAHANIDRTERYDRWYQLLLAELALVGPEAQIVAVGKVVASHLRKRGLRCDTILHYSDVAQPARAAAIRGHESEFEAFRSSVSVEDVLATAVKVLELVPAELREENRQATAPNEDSANDVRAEAPLRLQAHLHGAEMPGLTRSSSKAWACRAVRRKDVERCFCGHHAPPDALPRGTTRGLVRPGKAARQPRANRPTLARHATQTLCAETSLRHQLSCESRVATRCQICVVGHPSEAQFIT